QKKRNKQSRKLIIFEYKLAHEKQSFLPQKRGGQFRPNLHGHFKPNLGGQLHRTLHRMVYELYGLTEEEIEIVEKN
ncbi:hypothetical protein, partial [Kaistella sp.]|uniref:hypothetical protein n=1 Tax=Kaistella sp. TaxID=2782235 RepID=UPI0035A0B392